MKDESKKGLNQFKTLSEHLDPTILLEMFARYLEHSDAAKWDSGTLEKTIKGYIINRGELNTLLNNSGTTDDLFIIPAIRNEYKDNTNKPIRPFIVPVITTVNSSNQINQIDGVNNCLPILSFHPISGQNVLPLESNTFANTISMVKRYLSYYQPFIKSIGPPLEIIKGYTIKRNELNSLINDIRIQDIAIILGVRFLENSSSTTQLQSPYISPIIAGLDSNNKIIWETNALIDYCDPCPNACYNYAPIFE